MPATLWIVARTAAVAAVAWCSVAAQAGIVRVVEYERLRGGGGYFLTALPAEVAFLDESSVVGLTDRQRHRSGVQFSAYDGPGAGRVPVCRFYKTTPEPMGAHFYSAFASECEIVAADPAWTYEGVAFHAALPTADGSCPAGTAPMYRVFDGRSHRLTYSRVVRSLALGSGAVAEGAGPLGTVFCVPMADDVASARLTEFALGTWAFELAPGLDPWPESASFAAGPLDSAVDYWDYPPLLGTTVHARGMGNVVTARGLSSTIPARAAWQPYTGELLVMVGEEVLVRLDYSGGDFATGCWQRIWFPFYEPPLFWSAPCEPVTARRR